MGSWLRRCVRPAPHPEGHGFKEGNCSGFLRVLQKVSERHTPSTGEFRLLDRRVVEEINNFREHDRLRGMVSYVGFRQVAVQFDRDERFSGVTGYPLSKMIRLAADGVLGFFTFPLTVISRIGYAAAGLSLIGVLYALFMKPVPGAAIEGWTFILISVLFMDGLQLITLGIQGRYVEPITSRSRTAPLRGHNVYAGSRMSRGVCR